MVENRIKKLREKTGLSQKDFADEIGVNYSTYCSWEKGERTPLIGSAAKLASYHGVSLDYLLGRTDIVQDKYTILMDKLRTLSDEDFREVSQYVTFKILKSD